MTERAKEPGQNLFDYMTAEAVARGWARLDDSWSNVAGDDRAMFARVEAACRASALEEAAAKARAYGEAFRVPYANSYAEGCADASDTIERAIRALIPKQENDNAG